MLPKPVSNPRDDEGRRRLEELVGDCVHCGFCLPTCPTYQLWGREADSPRGRVHIVSQLTSGAPRTGSATLHLDRCLSCMACVTACPSGVRYGEIIELARAEVETATSRPLRERLTRRVIFSLFPYPRRLQVIRPLLLAAERSGLRKLVSDSALSARLPPVVPAMARLAPPLGPAARLPRFTPAKGRRRGTVALLTGCVQSVFFAHVNAATVRVLSAEGFDVLVPPGQSCCGALSLHLGRREEAARLAQRNVTALVSANVDFVVVNAAGCGSAMKECDRLFADGTEHRAAATWLAEHTRDVSELLADIEPRATRHPVKAKVAFHDACHLAHAQGIRSQPRQLLRQIPGLELVEVGDDNCCGSAGVYNLLEPDAAAELGARKAKAVAATGADVLVSTNPGCLMQIAASLKRLGKPARTAHLVEVLDCSLRGEALLVQE